MKHLDTSVKCHCCGKPILHDDAMPEFLLPDLLFKFKDQPTPEGSIIDKDMAYYDGNCYIRGQLPIPVTDREKEFRVGMWVEVAYTDLDTYVKNFRSPKKFEFKGMLANKLPNYPNEPILSVRVVTQGPDYVPLFYIEDETTSLGKIQKQGIQQHDITDFYGLNKSN